MVCCSNHSRIGNKYIMLETWCVSLHSLGYSSRIERLNEVHVYIGRGRDRYVVKDCLLVLNIQRALHTCGNVSVVLGFSDLVTIELGVELRQCNSKVHIGL